MVSRSMTSWLVCASGRRPCDARQEWSRVGYAAWGSFSREVRGHIAGRLSLRPFERASASGCVRGRPGRASGPISVHGGRGPAVPGVRPAPRLFPARVPGVGSGRRSRHGRCAGGLSLVAAERRRISGDHRRRSRPRSRGPDRLSVGAGGVVAVRPLPRAAQERSVPDHPGRRQGRAVRGSADPRDRFQRRDDAHGRHRAGECRCDRVLDGVGRAEVCAGGRPRPVGAVVPGEQGEPDRHRVDAVAAQPGDEHQVAAATCDIFSPSSPIIAGVHVVPGEGLGRR